MTNNPDSGLAVRQTALVNAAQGVAKNPLDQLSSADIAVHAARLTDLPEAVAVTNQADTEATTLAISGTENKVISKPQVITTALKSAKDIQTYTTVAGDTLSGLATRFGVTSDSIRWSNSLTSEQLPAGRQLVIPPVSGVVYVVKAGETADTLAVRYSSSKEQILADNDAELTGIRAGQRILIRGGVVNPPVGRTSVVASTGFFQATYGYNGYTYGYCTWYAANKRSQMGKPLPANLGNASTWFSRASLANLGVGNVPAAGAVIWTPPNDYYGHVGIVDEKYADGSIKISEMNAAGWARVSTKVLSAQEALRYRYIY